MQDVDSEAWLHGVNLFFDDEDLADLPFLLSDDEAPDSTNQNPENLIAEPSGSDVPSSGLLEGPEPSHNQYESCLETLLEIFPDISLEYVRELYNTWMQGPQSGSDMNQVLRAFEDITLQLLDTKSIPKEKDRTNELKRKRSPALDRHEDMSQRDSGRKEQKNARYIHAAYVFISSPKSFSSLATIFWVTPLFLISTCVFASLLAFLNQIVPGAEISS